jgi:hypothetical protein
MTAMKNQEETSGFRRRVLGRDSLFSTNRRVNQKMKDYRSNGLKPPRQASGNGQPTPSNLNDPAFENVS